jgi:hypothetical protein
MLHVIAVSLLPEIIWCRKRDHKDPVCVVESEIGNGRHVEVDGVPRENYERPIECPKWLGLDC